MNKNDKFLQTALERFKHADQFSKDNRKLFKEDMEFYASDQWAPEVRSLRENTSRPCLTVNRMPQFAHQITNNIRQNMPMIRAVGMEDSDVEVADITTGILRYIQNRSEAKIAYANANLSQVVSGLGYWRVTTEYCNKDNFEQDIFIKQIKDSLNVYFDPAAIELDYSDAMYCFITDDITHETFKRLYPGKKVVDSNSLIGALDTQMSWGSENKMRIAEYWCVKEKNDGKLYRLSDGSVIDELPDQETLDALGLEVLDEREKINRVVHWYKITGLEVLEGPIEWPGEYIPIIPLIGEEVFLNGKRILKGIVRDAKDSQRMYNYWLSAQTEMIALAPKAPYIAAVGQIQGLEKFWEAANIENYSVLTYNPIDVAGTLVGEPRRQTAEPPIQAMTQALMQSAEDMKATTGIYDASLGMRSNETSGKAINARKMQGDIANYHFIDNFVTALHHTGRIIIDLIPKIYTGERIIRILGDDGVMKQQKINQPVLVKGVEKIYDLNTAKYDIVVETGPSYQTKRQESLEAMTQILQANPQLWNVIGDQLVKSMDWPDAQIIAERLRKILPPELKEPEEGEAAPIPPQAQAQLQQASALIEQLTKQLNTLVEERNAKTAELESRERIEMEKMKNDLILKQMDIEGRGATTLLAQELQQINQRLSMLSVNEPVDNENHTDTIGSGQNAATGGESLGA